MVICDVCGRKTYRRKRCPFCQKMYCKACFGGEYRDDTYERFQKLCRVCFGRSVRREYPNKFNFKRHDVATHVFGGIKVYGRRMNCRCQFPSCLFGENHHRLLRPPYIADAIYHGWSNGDES